MNGLITLGVFSVKKARPVNLDLRTIHLPVTGYVSFFHRVSGVFSLAGVLVLLWVLDVSLRSEASFAQLQECMQVLWVKAVLWVVLSALAYHLLAGIRHLFMDAGLGESLEGGRLGAKLVLVSALGVMAALGVWLW